MAMSGSPGKDDLDRTVRIHLYQHLVETGQAPSAAETARMFSQPVSAIEDSYRRLAANRAIVLAPASVNIWMAHPFSAVPTAYRVQTARGGYWANCAWDALNIMALLGRDGEAAAHCPDCGALVTLAVRDGILAAPTDAVVHFAVPPRRFWENIGFT